MVWKALSCDEMRLKKYKLSLSSRKLGRTVSVIRSFRFMAAGVGLALTVTACGGGGAGKAEQDPSAPLELWARTTPGGDGEKGMKKLAAAFEAATGQKVEVTAIFDDFETKLSQR